MIDKIKLNELDRKRADKDKIVYAIILTCLLTMSFSAYWMLLEWYMFGEIMPNKVDDLVCIPIVLSFYFNAVAIIKKYFK